MEEAVVKQKVGTTIGNTVGSMASQALTEIAAAALLEQMNEHPRFGAGLLIVGGATIAAVGGWKMWNLKK